MTESYSPGSDADSEPITVEHQGDISIIRVPQPEFAILEPEGLQLFTEAFDSVRLHQSKVLVLYPAHSAYTPDTLDSFWRRVDAETDTRANHPLVKRVRYRLVQVLETLSEFNAFIIGTVRGPVDLEFLGLILACDFLIFSEDVELQNKTLDRGLAPASATLWFLARYIGLARTKRIIMEERSLSAQETLDLNLINRITSEAELEATALAEARRLAAKPLKSIRHLRESWEGIDLSFADYIKRFGPGLTLPK